MDKKILQNEKGTVFKIKVIANAKTNLLEEDTEFYKLRIKAPAVDNKANTELVKFLAQYFKISKSQVQILHGSKSSHKTILLEGVFIDSIL